MVRIARFAFDDPEDGRRAGMDDFDDVLDDCCIEFPQPAAARQPTPSGTRSNDSGPAEKTASNDSSVRKSA